MKEFGSLFYNAAIMDFGTSKVKADFAGQEVPTIQFNSIIGKPKYSKIFSVQSENDVIGPDDNNRGLYKLYHPIKRGLFINEVDTNRIISKVFKDLKVSDPSIIPVLITQPFILPKNNKKILSEIIFEKNKVNYLFFATQSVLSIFAHGKSDGVILESGEGITQIGTVFNGYKIENAFEQVDFGGFDVSSFLKFLFKRNGSFLNSTSEDCIFEEMKRKVCHINTDPLNPNTMNQGAKKDDSSKTEFMLPDGTKMVIRDERFLAGEVLFNPSIAGLPHPSLPEIIDKTIQRIDIDLTRFLCKNIYLSGGNTQISGFEERLAKELSMSFGSQYEKNIIASKGDRSILAWKGASIIANMSSFAKLWISKKEYDENGERIFLTKFF